MRRGTSLDRVDEVIAGLTHGLGAALGIVGLCVLVILAAQTGSARLIAGVCVYGATLVLLYSASSVYHLLRDGRIKAAFERLDHVAIFLLIAGTYTPFALVNMRGPVGYAVLAVIWSLALFGIAFKLTSRHRFARSTPLLYLAMGWIILVPLRTLIATTPTVGVALLIGGGVVYSAGVIFYAWERLPFNHAIWHGFVLGGSTLHFLAVLYAVVPLA
ncbi:MAG TPA: hemolysin III family protein [Candidatus Cybelea sp.]|nr:hemolysin III family protein [Candidatus Cybelea sp.]